jgi:single-strand DNA-binding protein
MSGINQVLVVGRMGQEIELRYAASGTAVANISVATSDKYKEVETTEWHRIVCFGKTAELAAQYVKKGDQVGFSGKLQTRKWQDQQGNDKYSTEIVARELYLMGNSRSGEQQPAAQQKPAQQEMRDDDGPAKAPPLDDGFDEIPF